MSTPSMPAIESSSGLVTCDSMTSDDAPISRVLTVTTGSSMRGYSRTDSRVNETSADQHEQQRHHGREHRAADRGFGQRIVGACAQAGAPTRRRRAGAGAPPAGAGRRARRPARRCRPRAPAAPSPRISRAWPAVTTMSPALSAFEDLDLARQAQRRCCASMRCDTLPFGAVDDLDQVLLAALRHQRLLGHHQRVLAHARTRCARARTCPACSTPPRVVEPRAHQQRAAVGVEQRIERIDPAGEAAPGHARRAPPRPPGRPSARAMKRSGRRKSTHIGDRSSMFTRSAPSLT